MVVTDGGMTQGVGEALGMKAVHLKTGQRISCRIDQPGDVFGSKRKVV